MKEKQKSCFLTTFVEPSFSTSRERHKTYPISVNTDCNSPNVHTPINFHALNVQKITQA